VAGEDLGRRVQAIWPHDGARFSIQPRKIEVVGISQWLSEDTSEEELAVNIAYQAVAEADSQVLSVKHPHVCDLDHPYILRQPLSSVIGSFSEESEGTWPRHHE
jgi:hypothetical protein